MFRKVSCRTTQVLVLIQVIGLSLRCVLTKVGSILDAVNPEGWTPSLMLVAVYLPDCPNSLGFIAKLEETSFRQLSRGANKMAAHFKSAYSINENRESEVPNMYNRTLTADTYKPTIQKFTKCALSSKENKTKQEK